MPVVDERILAKRIARNVRKRRYRLHPGQRNRVWCDTRRRRNRNRDRRYGRSCSWRRCSSRISRLACPYRYETDRNRACRNSHTRTMLS